MSWNYRIVKTEKGYGVFEVYYNDSGKPNGRAIAPALDFYCDTPDELIEIVELIKSSLEKNKAILTDIELGVLDDI